MDLTKREKIGLSVFLFVLLLLLSIIYFNKNNKETVDVISKSDTVNQANQISSSGGNSISVYICGEINKPGVYTLNDGDRMIKLIETAGGFTAASDTSSINLAMKLKDEDFIKIPSKNMTNIPKEQINPTAVNGNTAVQSDLINLNTADKEKLKELPRVGDTIAQRIIDYRESNGPFRSINDITQVKGIGEKMFENIKSLITVR